MNDETAELETIEPVAVVEADRTPDQQISDLIEPTLETTPDNPGTDDQDQETELETTTDQDQDQDPPAIDFDAEVAMPDGLETKTVGQLKDFFRDNQEWEQARDAWEENRRDQDNQQMVTRNRLVRLAEQLGNEKPEVLAEIVQAEKFNAEKQQHLLLQVYPEWSDTEIRKTASASMLATAKEYGFTEQEYFNIPDHRQIKLLNDHSKLLEKTRKAKERLAEVEKLANDPPKGQKPKPRKQTSRAAQQDLINTAAKTGTQADKDRAISSLISG